MFPKTDRHLQEFCFNITFVSTCTYIFNNLLLSLITVKNVIFIFRKGRSTATCSRDNADDKIIISERVKKIIDCADISQFLTSLNINIDSYNLKPCCSELLTNNVLNLKNFHKAIICDQKSVLWQEERQLRITQVRDFFYVFGLLFLIMSYFFINGVFF